MRYITANNIEMIQTNLLNWQVLKKYAIDCNPNPEFYVIHIGSLSDMWQAVFIPETNIVSFTSSDYSSNEVHRFKVKSLNEASELVLKFTEGMNQTDNLKGTIYMN